MGSLRGVEHDSFNQTSIAGGKTSPMIEFIYHMSKQCGDNPRLGEEVMCTLVETQWCKKALHPFTKVALAVTNCTSNKLGDGVARFSTKTDILALKVKT